MKKIQLPVSDRTSYAFWCILLVGIGYAIGRQIKHDSLDPGRKQVSLPAVAPSHVALPPLLVEGVAVGVQPSTPEESAGSSVVHPAIVDSPTAWGSSGVFSNLTDSFLPTADGLYARTSDLWSQEEFLTARFQIEDLPTHDDCAAGLLCPGVQEILNTLVSDETVAYAIFDNRRAGRGIKHSLQQTLDADYSSLFDVLDRCGPYRNWALIGEEFRRWDK